MAKMLKQIIYGIREMFVKPSSSQTDDSWLTTLPEPAVNISFVGIYVEEVEHFECLFNQYTIYNAIYNYRINGQHYRYRELTDCKSIPEFAVWRLRRECEIILAAKEFQASSTLLMT